MITQTVRTAGLDRALSTVAAARCTLPVLHDPGKVGTPFAKRVCGAT